MTARHTRLPAFEPPTPVRSRMLAAVRATGNKSTELELVRLFRRNGITGWRRHGALAGRPDFVFRAPRIAVFVDGCFWHGCPRCYKAPTRNPAYWSQKILANRRRDKRVTRVLRAQKWCVLRVWEHALTRPDAALERIARAIRRRNSA